MARTAVVSKTLLARAVKAVEEAANLDKAVARLAGVLYPTFFPRRVDVGMPINQDRLVICGVWSSHPTRLKKGTILQTSATGFPDLVEHAGVVLSADCPRTPAGEALKQEQVQAWIAVPIPSARVIEGGLGLCANKDVFSAHREFFGLLGEAIGGRLAELARRSEPYLRERESILVLDRASDPHLSVLLDEL